MNQEEEGPSGYGLSSLDQGQKFVSYGWK